VANRLSVARNGTTTSSTYDKADRLITVGGASWTTNANGNLTARGGDTFSYDQANRLIGATVGGVTTTYAYDGDGKRASSTSGGVTTNHYYDVAAGLPLVLDDGSRKYLWGRDGLSKLRITSNAAYQYFHSDGLGSVRAITDTVPSVIQTYRTDAFGMPMTPGTQGVAGQAFQYAGEPRDGTGLVYLRARVYDPSVGRFLQRDAFAGHGGVPQSLNRYAYALGNPIGLVDPSGLSVEHPAGTPGGPGGSAVLSDPRKNPGPWDDECKNSLGGFFLGFLINPRCLVILWNGQPILLVETPMGPMPVPGYAPATDPSGGGNGSDEDGDPPKGGPSGPGLGPEGTHPPGYDPDTWTIQDPSTRGAGKKGEKVYRDPAGNEWRYHPEDSTHYPHWDTIGGTHPARTKSKVPLEPGGPTTKPGAPTRT
jgi:RHS repeat-associated protein